LRRIKMATRTEELSQSQTQPLVKITEMDHIVLRVRDVESSLRFYTQVLGMPAERVEQWRAGEIRFPSARLNADTIIDFFGSDQEPVGRDGAKNQDHYCMVIEPTDMEELKAKFESIGVDIQAGPGKRWGSHGDGISLYIYDPDDNVVELRHY
jgi:catechol 2,3-dioxygenase-like lactoylglutathione lyase family enzyme